MNFKVILMNLKIFLKLIIEFQEKMKELKIYFSFY